MIDNKMRSMSGSSTSSSSSTVRRLSGKPQQAKAVPMKLDHDDDDDATSKNNFVQKLWLMATCEDPTIISFTRGKNDVTVCLIVCIGLD